MPHPTDEILTVMASPTPKDREAIEHVYEFAKTAHGDEMRRSGEPYITHPAAIALTLAKLGMDTDTIVAGMLHDTLEDTKVTADDIEKEFGKTVRFLVESVTKISKFKYRGLQRHVESLRRLLVATASDIRVIIIKFADRLHNMHTIQFIEPAEKRNRIASETMEVYVPIAERLGMGKVKAELEDLSFAVLDPKAYKEAAAVIEEQRKEKEKAIEEAIKHIKRALAEGGILNFRTETRIKSAHSFAKKLVEKEKNIERVYDLFAVRVIVSTIEDCYRAMGILHNRFRPIPGRIKDYIAVPKPNGYRSLHTTIITGNGLTFEVQIRTEEMHRESQFGVASHLNYKTQSTSRVMSSVNWIQSLLPYMMRKPKDESKSAVPRWLRDLTDIEGEHPEHEAFQETLQKDFFAERMFIFTPQGDAIDLPVGATPVDFAYAVHTDLVDRMVGAKVNGKLIHLQNELKNGDVVEIQINKNGVPKKKWLDYAKTTAAKRHIRVALKKLEEGRK